MKKNQKWVTIVIVFSLLCPSCDKSIANPKAGLIGTWTVTSYDTISCLDATLNASTPCTSACTLIITATTLSAGAGSTPSSYTATGSSILVKSSTTTVTYDYLVSGSTLTLTTDYSGTGAGCRLKVILTRVV